MPPRPTDPAALVAWGRALLVEVHGLEDRIGNDFYSIGERLNALHPKEVYRALGYRTFGQLVAREKLWSRYWATALVGIVKALRPEQARTLGPTKCWWLIRYAVAKGAKAHELLDRGAQIDGTPVHELTARELQALAAQERARRKGLLGTPAHRNAEATRRLVSRTVRARGAKDPNVRVLLRGQSWWIRVDVRAEDAVAAIIGPTPGETSPPS